MPAQSAAMSPSSRSEARRRWGIYTAEGVWVGMTSIFGVPGSNTLCGRRRDRQARLDHRRFDRHRACAGAQAGAMTGVWRPPRAASRRSRRWRPKGRARSMRSPLNVTETAAAARVGAEIQAALGPIDLLIANASTHAPTTADAFDAAQSRHLIEINLIGVTKTLAAAKPAMVARRNGQIASVASVAGYRGLPRAAVYPATKAGLIALAEGLKFDLDRAGVKNPGVQSGLRANAAHRQERLPHAVPDGSRGCGRPSAGSRAYARAPSRS